MNRKFLLAFAIVLLSQASATSRSFQSPPQAAKTSEVSIPFELVTRHIMVKIKINNSRLLSFALDTGDKVGIVDIDVAKELGLSLQGRVHVGGAGSDTLTGSFVQGATWTMSGLEGFSQPITVAIPLRRLAARFGHDFDGIIGHDFIKQFVVEVDYQARLIKLHDKDRFSYSGSGESIPIQFSNQGYPIIEAEVTPMGSQPIKGKYVLDIGSGNGLSLHSPFVREQHLLNSDLKTIRAIGTGGAGGASFGRLGRVSELKIGKYRIASLTAFFSEDKAGAMANPTLAGNIGQQIASRFRLFLDYNRQRIILEPAVTFGEPFDPSQSGIALSAEGSHFTTFRITDVLEDSPASEIGLRQDDVIIKVDNQPASELTITKLNEMFEKPAAYTITIRRGDQTLQVTLTTRKLI